MTPLMPPGGGDQRWRARRTFFVPPLFRFDPRRYDVGPLAAAVAKTFVVQHHYSASFPAARFRFGLFGPASLEGVAVFSVPCHDAVLTNTFPIPASAAVELGRFVLLDSAGFNAESWFLSRCLELLRAAGIRGVVSFSDPVPRTTFDGRLVFPGHVGGIYQASSARYLGRGRARTIRLLPDGRVFSERAFSKLRACTPGRPRPQAWRCAAAVLEQAARDLGLDAPPVPVEGDAAAWAVALVARVTRPLRHSGNHKYAFCIDRRLRRSLPAAIEYPKTRDAA